MSRAQVIEDDGQVLKTAAASSAGPVQEEHQRQEPDGEIQSTFLPDLLFAPCYK